MRDSKYFDDCIIVVYVGVNGGSVGGHALAIWHTKAPQLRLQNVAPDQLQGGHAFHFIYVTQTMCTTYSIDISLAVCITEDLKRASPWNLCMQLSAQAKLPDSGAGEGAGTVIGSINKACSSVDRWIQLHAVSGILLLVWAVLCCYVLSVYIIYGNGPACLSLAWWCHIPQPFAMHSRSSLLWVVCTCACDHATHYRCVVPNHLKR